MYIHPLEIWNDTWFLPYLNSVHSVDVLGSIFAFIKLENTTLHQRDPMRNICTTIVSTLFGWPITFDKHLRACTSTLNLTFLGKRQPSSYRKKTSNYLLPTFKNISHTKSGEKKSPIISGWWLNHPSLKKIWVKLDIFPKIEMNLMTNIYVYSRNHQPPRFHQPGNLAGLHLGVDGGPFFCL